MIFPPCFITREFFSFDLWLGGVLVAADEDNDAFYTSAREQIKLISQTNVFITVCGGGAMTATFLPKDSTLIVYYQQTGGFNFFSFNFTHTPAILDWDLFNNASYLRVHWLPIEGMDTKEGQEMLLSLIQHEYHDYVDEINNYRDEEKDDDDD